MSCCGGCNDRGGGCPHRLSYHTDVSQVPPDNQDVLCWNAIAGVWLPCELSDLVADLNIGNTFIPHSLDDHTNVDTTGEANGDVLTFNGTTWVPSAPGGIGVLDLDDLGDVNAPTPAANDFLMWNGTSWVPTSIVAGLTPHGLTDHTDVNTAGAATGEVLTWNGTTWVPQTAPTSTTVPAHTLGFHSDVSTAGATDGDILGFNGTSWLPIDNPNNPNQQVVTGRLSITGVTTSILAGTGFTVGATTSVVTPTTPFNGAALIVYTRETATGNPNVDAQGTVVVGSPTVPAVDSFILSGTNFRIIPAGANTAAFQGIWNFAMIGPV